MSKGLEALKALVDTMPFAFIETNSMKYVEIIEKELKALEIIKKYYKVNETYDELFPYELKDDQYVSSGSCNVITQKDFDLLKEVF